MSELNTNDIKLAIVEELKNMSHCVSDKEELEEFNISAMAVENLVNQLVSENNYLMERLKHSETERFNRDVRRSYVI